MQQHKGSTSHQRSVLHLPPVPVLPKEQRKTGGNSGKRHILVARESWLVARGAERSDGFVQWWGRGEKLLD